MDTAVREVFTLEMSRRTDLLCRGTQCQSACVDLGQFGGGSTGDLNAGTALTENHYITTELKLIHVIRRRTDTLYCVDYI